MYMILIVLGTVVVVMSIISPINIFIGGIFGILIITIGCLIKCRKK